MLFVCVCVCVGANECGANNNLAAARARERGQAGQAQRELHAGYQLESIGPSQRPDAVVIMVVASLCRERAAVAIVQFHASFLITFEVPSARSSACPFVRRLKASRQDRTGSEHNVCVE